jgi:hypothetical protein
MTTYIYTLEHPITNEIRYIGKTNSPDRRLHHHWTVGYKSNNKTGNWLKSLKKLKLKPIMTIIDESTDNWQQLEMYWISQFKTWGFILTNHTDGGEGAYGAGQWNNKPVSAYTKDGKFIKSFESQKQCAEYFKTSQSNVKLCVNGKNVLLLKKYQIRFGINNNDIPPAPKYKKYELKNKPKTHWLSKPIRCNEDNIEFTSATEAAEYYGILKTSINNILNGKSKQTRNKKSFSYI